MPTKDLESGAWTGGFIPGLELCRAFHDEAVRPLLAEVFPILRYSAALLGTGSEVLGFDTERSTDHHWGPRLQVFLEPPAHAAQAEAVKERLARRLPFSFRGYPTNWGPSDEGGVQLLAPIEQGPVNHRVALLTVDTFFRTLLGFDPRASLYLRDWLLTPAQILLSVTAGAVYHDGLGELEPIREKLAWYPHDLWLYLIACQWTRIEQEEAFVGRCVEISDELGSRIVVARLVRDLMKLCFLLERRYAPYSKWLGTAFARLQCAGMLAPVLDRTLAAQDPQTREDRLAAAFELVAQQHNGLAITEFVEPISRIFHGRPYRVLRAERFAEATRLAIRDEAVLALPVGVGSIDQFVDSTDVLSRPQRARRLGSIYE
ncbi:MAG: DUF4037 domain-containing protein [Dehalococcoidia bacterium]